MKKRWIILIVIAVLLIGWCFLARLHAYNEFNRRVNALSAQGFPVSLANLEKANALPQGVKNAANVYIEAFALYQEPNEVEKKLLPLRGDYWNTGRVLPLPQGSLGAIKKSLEANQKTLELLDKAAEIEHCFFPRNRDDNWLKNEYLSQIKDSVKLLCERNLYLAQTNQTGMLLNSFLTLSKLSDIQDQQVSLIDLLVAISNKWRATENIRDILNRVKFSEIQLALLQQRFAQLQKPEMLYHTLVNERAGTIEFFNIPVYKRDNSKDKLEIFLNVLYHVLGLEKQESSRILDCLEQYINASQWLPHERSCAFKQIDTEVRESLYLYFGYYDNSCYASICNVDLRILGSLRCAETALAIERYRLQYQSLPQSLEQLVPEFMAQLPREPFDNEVLRYIRHDVGYTVYTIGEDGIDNGGFSQDQMKEKTGESKPTEFDWPFTVKR